MSNKYHMLFKEDKMENKNIGNLGALRRNKRNQGRRGTGSGGTEKEVSVLIKKKNSYRGEKTK